MGPMHHHRTTRPHFVGEDSAGTCRHAMPWLCAAVIAAGCSTTTVASSAPNIAGEGLSVTNQSAATTLASDPLWDWEIILKADIDGDGWIGPPPPPPPPPGGGGGVA